MIATIDLTELDWDDAGAVDDLFALRVAAQQADQPDDPPHCPIKHRAIGRFPWPATVEPVWLARRHGEPVAALMAYLPLEENRDVFGFDLMVHPDHRGKGIGRAVLEQAYDLARGFGRQRLLTEVSEPLEGGGRHRRFAEAAGWRLVLSDMQRRLDLATVDRAAHQQLLADAWQHAAGYSVEQWVGPTPDHLVDGCAVIDARMSTDPPLGDLEWEPERPDPTRVRTRDAMLAGRGMTRYATVARHDASGEVVGSTSLVRTTSVPTAGHQWETLVLEGHRGHRLGLILKLENLRFVRAHEPQLRTIDTWNATSNAPMVAVNEAMGYRPLRRWGEWEFRLS